MTIQQQRILREIIAATERVDQILRASGDTADPATEPPSQAPTMPPAGPDAERLRNARQGTGEQ